MGGRIMGYNNRFRQRRLCGVAASRQSAAFFARNREVGGALPSRRYGIFQRNHILRAALRNLRLLRIDGPRPARNNTNRWPIKGDHLTSGSRGRTIACTKAPRRISRASSTSGRSDGGQKGSGMGSNHGLALRLLCSYLLFLPGRPR